MSDIAYQIRPRAAVLSFLASLALASGYLVLVETCLLELMSLLTYGLPMIGASA